MTLKTWWPFPLDMINIIGNAGTNYPQSRDHFKICCQPCAHAGCLISQSQRSRKWPWWPYTKPPKQLFNNRLALAAISCTLHYTTTVFQDITTFYPRVFLFVLLLQRKQRVNWVDRNSTRTQCQYDTRNPIYALLSVQKMWPEY